MACALVDVTEVAPAHWGLEGHKAVAQGSPVWGHLHPTLAPVLLFHVLGRPACREDDAWIMTGRFENPIHRMGVHT